MMPLYDVIFKIYFWDQYSPKNKGASNSFVMKVQVFIEITKISANNINGIVWIYI